MLSASSSQGMNDRLFVCSCNVIVQVRTHAYRKAHENIDSTLKAAESVLTRFDVSRQVMISWSFPLSSFLFFKGRRRPCRAVHETWGGFFSPGRNWGASERKIT
jgi:hypothetical protein